jgi:hypothetical protein
MAVQTKVQVPTRPLGGHGFKGKRGTHRERDKMEGTAMRIKVTSVYVDDQE